MIDFHNIDRSINKADSCNVEEFDDAAKSYTNFTNNIEVVRFRHLSGVKIDFSHPVTIISGTNKVGKTSLLLLLACSHEKFLRLDSSKPEPTLREHIWKDVMAFTKYETETNDYIYRLQWRVGKKKNSGEGKRLATSQAWSGLGKKAKDRTNAKIKNREVRLIDLDRLLPARSFSASLLRKTANTASVKLHDDVAKAFCYILDIPWGQAFSILEVSGHVNKRCYVISDGAGAYSSYNSASGEESLIGILREVIESPPSSLILIDEIEAGLHPSVQRKLAKVISLISWEHKKQFIITTHSPTIIDSFPVRSRRFLEVVVGKYHVLNGISPQAAMSKMDAIGHPLVMLYLEDDLAKFLVDKVLIDLSRIYSSFRGLIDICMSGPASDVKIDYARHKFRFGKVKSGLGFCAIFDGDMKGKVQFADIAADENVMFMFPQDAPEKFLVEAFLESNPNPQLSAFLAADNHHAAFGKMVDLNLASDKSDARNQCFEAFKNTPEYETFFAELSEFLRGVVQRFSDP